MAGSCFFLLDRSRLASLTLRDYSKVLGGYKPSSSRKRSTAPDEVWRLHVAARAPLATLSENNVPEIAGNGCDRRPLLSHAAAGTRDWWQDSGPGHRSDGGRSEWSESDRDQRRHRRQPHGDDK